MSHPLQPPTLTDKLLLLPVLARALLSALTRAITGPLFGGPRANTYLKDIIFAALRTQLSIVSPAGEQILNASTESGYLELAKAKKFQPETTVLEGGLKLHWIGPKTAKKVVLFFHGGGYVLSASPGHWRWLWELQRGLTKSASVSVVVVGYTLAPHGQYPKQLFEAVEATKWLVETQGYKPSDIVLGGDSAGGNLATALMLHFLHPHPRVQDDFKLSEPFAGAVLISPWWKFKTDDASAVRNATSDMVTPTAANRWSSAFLGSAPGDPYNQPYLADTEYFMGLQSIAKDILIWGGGGELLIDSIRSVSKKIRDAHPRVALEIAPGAGHEDFIFDKMFGYKESISGGAELIESWIAERV